MSTTLEQVRSIKDPRVVLARSLTRATGRRESGRLLLQGEQSIRWALEAGVIVEHTFVQEQVSESLVVLCREAGVPLLSVSDGILKKISGTRYIVPCIAIALIPSRLVEELFQGPLALVVDDVQDHGNLGTIVRTARAFGVREVLCTRPETDFWYRKTIEASRGQVFSTAFRRFASPTETVSWLKASGVQIVATSPRGDRLQSQMALGARPAALVVGNETRGVADEILEQADAIVQIPMSGAVESLNVGVSTGISLYEIKLKVLMAMLTDTIRSTLGRQLNVASQLMMRALDKPLKRISELGSTQAVFMMVLCCEGSMTLDQLGHDLGLYGQEAEEMLQSLTASGYVSRTSDVVCLLDTGHEFLAQTWGIIEAAEAGALTGFTDVERRQFESFLQRVQANCMAMIEGDKWVGDDHK